MLSTYVPDVDNTGPLLAQRSLYVTHGEHWIFGADGPPLLFEDLDRYRTRRVRDRFTFETLCDYLEALGVRAFDKDSYMPDGRAILIEKEGHDVPSSREFTLERLQNDAEPPSPENEQVSAVIKST